MEIFGGERELGHGVEELAEPAGPPVPLYRQEKFEPEISGLRSGDFWGYFRIGLSPGKTLARPDISGCDSEISGPYDFLAPKSFSISALTSGEAESEIEPEISGPMSGNL